YSGLFILLQRRLRLRLIRLAPDRFRAIVQGPVLYLLPGGQKQRALQEGAHFGIIYGVTSGMKEGQAESLD
ncbi:hypothetical protein, partial [Thermoflexus sp.]|uniref:hypothetical protein n=1 Tax=Thermoflexus sp. TaxID=1969742 RepID=UPI003C0B7451